MFIFVPTIPYYTLMNKLRFFIGLFFILLSFTVVAQNESDSVNYRPEISIDTRFGYYHDLTNNNGSFVGDQLYLDVAGDITSNLSYSLNYRLFSYYDDVTTFADRINWLNLSYQVGDFTFTAGKDCIMLGSFEYDQYDLDAYYIMNSIAYNMSSAWQWGIYATWAITDNQTIIFQFANSPLSDGFSSLFSYNLAWRGEWDMYESYWSANLWEYDSGKFVKSLNFGNRFNFGDFSVEVDYLNSAVSMGSLFSEEVTIMATPSYSIGERFRVFMKLGWEKSSGIFDEEFIGENLFYGAGVEFFPIKEKENLRLHLIWGGNNNYTSNNTISAGITWKIKL